MNSIHLLSLCLSVTSVVAQDRFAAAQSFWYQVRTGPDRHEFGWIDAANGSRKTGATLKELGLPAEEAQKTSTLKLDLRPTKRTGLRRPCLAAHHGQGQPSRSARSRASDADLHHRWPRALQAKGREAPEETAWLPSAFAPKDFDRQIRLHQIAELGFIVVKLDGMGTNHRGKAFHDVCRKNLKDAGFPDRKRWIAAAAATRPWMDLRRAGIIGGSAGGQNAMRALLDHADFYHVAVADCGCHDNRMDKIWWNEPWMGWPVDESYLRSGNVEDAHKLNGKLLLIVGELDTNVDPASTTQVVHALQKAGKSFDFMPIIGVGHGAAETPYGSRLRMEFLVRHLRP